MGPKGTIISLNKVQLKCIYEITSKGKIWHLRNKRDFNVRFGLLKKAEVLSMLKTLLHTFETRQATKRWHWNGYVEGIKGINELGHLELKNCFCEKITFRFLFLQQSLSRKVFPQISNVTIFTFLNHKKRKISEFGLIKIRKEF